MDRKHPFPVESSTQQQQLQQESNSPPKKFKMKVIGVPDVGAKSRVETQIKIWLKPEWNVDNEVCFNTFFLIDLQYFF